MTANNKLRNKESETPTIMDLDKSIPAILTVLGRQLSGVASAKFIELYGINIVDWRILSALAMEPDLSARQICSATVFDKALISKRLNLLNGAGYVKTRRCENNKSRTRTSLTSKGQELYAGLVEVALEGENSLLTEFSATEKQTLLRLLLKLQKNTP